MGARPETSGGIRTAARSGTRLSQALARRNKGSLPASRIPCATRRTSPMTRTRGGPLDRPRYRLSRRRIDKRTRSGAAARWSLALRAAPSSPASVRRADNGRGSSARSTRGVRRTTPRGARGTVPYTRSIASSAVFASASQPVSISPVMATAKICVVMVALSRDGWRCPNAALSARPVALPVPAPVPNRWHPSVPYCAPWPSASA